MRFDEMFVSVEHNLKFINFFLISPNKQKESAKTAAKRKRLKSVNASNIKSSDDESDELPDYGNGIDTTIDDNVGDTSTDGGKKYNQS